MKGISAREIHKMRKKAFGVSSVFRGRRLTDESHMHFLSRLVEEKIKQAIAEGEFDNLPGHGKPLMLEDFSEAPEHMRMAFKILKNAGVLPLEMELRNEIATLRQQLEDCKDESQQRHLRKELNDKSLKYNLLMERNQRRQRMIGNE